MDKQEILANFEILIEYMKEQEMRANLEEYRNSFSAFLSFAGHLHPYEYISADCAEKSVLDIGCFIGYGEKILSHKAAEVVALDMNETVLAHAQKRFGAPNVQFQLTDGKQLTFEKERFDVVLAFQLLEHLPPKQVLSFLTEVKRVLKPNGTLCLTTPNRKFRLYPFQRPLNPEHYQEFTARKLARILRTVFSEIQLLGVRAQPWIEEIERKRVRRSLFNAFVRPSLVRLIQAIFPAKVRAFSKKTILRQKPSPAMKTSPEQREHNFNEYFRQFEENSYYLVDTDIDQSMDLMVRATKS